MIYWGDGSRNFTEKRRMLLDANSSSAIDALDLNRDGWVDLVVSATRLISTMRQARTSIGEARRAFPVRIGCSSRPSACIWSNGGRGNIYHRKYEWDTVSPPLKRRKTRGLGGYSGKLGPSLEPE